MYIQTEYRNTYMHAHAYSHNMSYTCIMHIAHSFNLYPSKQ